LKPPWRKWQNERNQEETGVDEEKKERQEEEAGVLDSWREENC
jgi:hypothetical protein